VKISSAKEAPPGADAHAFPMMHEEQLNVELMILIYYCC
jgi:hypothetical protein